MGKRRGQGEGTLYFDESRRRWVGQAWIDGRRRKVSDRDKIVAASKLGRLIHGDPDERHADRKLTVAKLLDDWRTKALPGKNRAPSTIERHDWLIRLLTAEIGKVRAADLDVDTVEKALGRLAGGSQGSKLSKETMLKVRSTLRQALEWAQKRRAVTFNAAAVAELPTDLADGDDKRALSRDELDRLLAVLDEHPWSAMFRCSAQLGLRPGEAAGLCVDAIDLGAGTLSVIRAVQIERGRPILTDDLKTKASRRTLEMPSSLTTALNLHLGDIDDGLLWTAPDGGPVWPSTVRTELRNACATAKVIPAARPNELRHTCATLLADDGVPPHVLADLLGHTSTQMVMQFYRHRPAIIKLTGTVGLEA